tara:strand:- start:5030 stop:5794 length:765 start_codon:yes stop_codon:yes gene_type:complete
MAIKETLSYSEGSKGWPSFYSYIPEYMMGMNSYFYSFDQGNLYRHNTNTVRNNYYGEQFISSVTGVFNYKPQQVKVFKTMSFESNAAWECKNLITDLSSGEMLDTYFEQKEGEWFSYIRNENTLLDFKLRSANGLGSLLNLSLPTVGVSTVTLTFDFNLGNIIGYGDAVFYESGNVNELIGTVVSVTDKSINVLYSGAVPSISPGEFIFYYKNPVAESNGARGYFMQFTIELPLNVITPVELFSVGSSIMQSYP